MGEDWEPDFSASVTGNAVLDAARGVTGSGAAAKKEQGGTEWTRLELCVIASLQLALVLVAYRLDRSQHPVLLSESAVAIFFGVLFGAGVLIFYPMESLNNGMDPEVLFYALLPPIILEAGFNMKKRGFFSNFNAIMLLSIVGTLIATFITGGVLLWIGDMGLITKLTAAEAYLYGALISAVDPVATLSVFKKNGVPPLLFNLVFGESMLNDGVAIVSFTLFQKLIRNGIADVTLNNAGLIIIEVFGIGFGSVGLAAVVCFTSAFLLKQADPVLQQYPSYEISIVLLSAYLSYVIADLVGMSGIVALFFSGVLMSHYHLYNIADDSATALRHLLTTSSFLAENFVFIYMGMSVVAYSGYFTWDWGFILVNMIACLVGRMLNTFPMCMLANLGRSEENKIPWSYMVVIWFAGLRGAIAFALALNVYTPNRVHASVIQSTTLFTVMFTTLVFGMGTSPVLRYFGLTATQEQEREFDDEGAHERLLSDDDEHDADTSFHPIDRSTSRRQMGGIHGVWERLDEKYLKPLFGGLPRDQQDAPPSPAELKRPAKDPSSPSPRNRRNHKQKQSPKQSSPKSSATSMPHMSLAAIAENHDAADNAV
ncbi:Sodium/hydrogen exchanger 3 [Phytophthora megakarya]|uniref:Sodium/hydrogen exchanger n=1 Tax=Phytophthora megakarya TaxID=4795 RepID=A0A225VHX2_9STRA|nr:Sodium/hydrogen exchanger 3 [Phytophthora megakarya]